MFDRFVQFHKLNNLIWVWSVDRPSKPGMEFANYYPGDEYLYILALDVYGSVLRVKDSVNPEVVLIGNSITHFWGGLPQLKYADGKLREPNGPTSWASIFGPYRVLNLGFGWDRTQNVLWRLDHGELDGLQPRVVIIDLGTNNTTQTKNAGNNTAAEIISRNDEPSFVLHRFLSFFWHLTFLPVAYNSEKRLF